MLSSQGPVQDPNLIPLLIALAIMLIVWWRVALMIIAIALVVVLGLGAVEAIRDMHYAVGR
jgi:uncharacterized membrane protein